MNELFIAFFLVGPSDQARVGWGLGFVFFFSFFLIFWCRHCIIVFANTPNAHLHFVWIGIGEENGNKKKEMMSFPLFGCKEGKEDRWSWME